MAEKQLTLRVQGKHKTWTFTVLHDPQYIDEWVADGLDVRLLCNTWPRWVVRWRLVKPWAFAQDVFNFRNPFRSE